MTKKSGFCVGVLGESWESLAKTLHDDYDISFSYVASNHSMLSLQCLSESCSDELLDLYRGKLSNGDINVEYKVDAILLEKYRDVEQICLELADRMDKGYSFSRVERERLFLAFLNYWLNLLDKLEPDFIIFSTTPHSVAEFVLYSIAKHRNIPVIMFMQLVTIERVIYYYDYKNISEVYQSDYEKLCSQDSGNSGLADDLALYFERYQDNYRDAMPAYLRERLDQHVGKKSTTKTSHDLVTKILTPRKYLNVAKRFLHAVKSVNKELKAPINYLKMPGMALEANGGLNAEQWHAYKQGAAEYKKALQEKYNELCSDFNHEDKYIYSPLHFQPERTTCPEGGRYSNQLMMLRVISQSIPDDWVIYVKENPSQLLPNTAHGERGRYPYYFDDVVNIDKVRLVSLDVDPFSLIDNSQAVSTLTGTSGWEAILRGKTALCFGYTWYQDFDGVIRIKGLDDCQKAIASLGQSSRVSPEKIKYFLEAVDKNSFKGFLNEKRYKNIEEGYKNNYENLLPILTKFIGNC